MALSTIVLLLLLFLSVTFSFVRQHKDESIIHNLMDLISQNENIIEENIKKIRVLQFEKDALLAKCSQLECREKVKTEQETPV